MGKEYFKNSIINIYDQNGDLMLNYDELIRKETTMQSLASKPSFSKIGKYSGQMKLH